MPSFSVDSKGDRIKTDILICGYIRKFVGQYLIHVPKEITRIIFLFWFVKVCDEWDRSLCPQSVIINGSSVKLNKNKTHTIFGVNAIETGTYEWIFKLVTEVKWFCIGIIRDDMKILKSYQHSAMYFDEAHGVQLGNYGSMYGIPDGIRYLCSRQRLTEKGTIIIMTLDMDKSTISFKINDQQYATKSISLSIKKYRLALSLKNVEEEIELL